MNFRFHPLLAALLMLSANLSYAQTQTLQGLSSFKKSSLSPVYEGSEVKGYFLFYKADKADKKNDNYGIDVFDQDLTKVKTISFQKPMYSYYPLRNSYNGSAFSFYSCNPKKQTLEIETYGRDLNKLASKEIPLSKAAKMIMKQEFAQPGMLESNPFTGLALYPVPNQGFIRNDYDGMMKGFSLEMYDNNLKEVWRYETDKKAKEYESLLVNEVTEKYLLATIGRRPNMLSKKMTFSMAVFDVKTGKKILDQPVESNPTEQLSLSSISFDEEKGEFITVGEYYRLEDKPFVNKSLGFFIKQFSDRGEEKSASFYAWDKDVNKLLPAAAKESVEKGFVNFIHKITKTKDGRYFIVAEQYRIAADGAGIALKAIGGSTSVAKGVVGNLMVLTLSPALALQDIAFYEKEQWEVSLPAGSGFYGAGLLGHVIKMQNGFHLQFALKSNDGQAFHIAYLNYEKQKGKEVKKTLVNIMTGKEKEFIEDKIDISASKTTNSMVYPAKMGYVMVLDSHPSESRIGMKLMKVNQ